MLNNLIQIEIHRRMAKQTIYRNNRLKTNKIPYNILLVNLDIFFIYFYAFLNSFEQFSSNNKNNINFSQFFVRLDHIRKCFTQKGGIFILEEFSK